MIDSDLLPESGVTRDELSQRAKRFAEFLKQEQIPLSIVGFSPDLFYFTGSIQFGYVLITAEGETVYLVKKDPERARIESPLDTVIPFSRFQEIGEAVRKLIGRMPKTVGLSLDVVPTNLFLRFKDLLDRAHIVDDSKLIRSCRMIKSPFEIDRIRQGIEIYDKVILEMPDLIHVGMTEAEAEETLILALRRHGHQGMVRMRGWNQVGLDGYLYAGKCAAVPTFIDAPLGGVGMTPAVATRGGRYKIAKDEPLVFDASPGVGGYMSDQTRTVVFGALSPRPMEAYTVAVEIIHRFEAEAKPGDLCGDWFDKMTAIAQKAGFEDNFMGYREKRAKFVGHGIGLELNEWPVLGKNMPWRLEPGMVLAVEPKIVFPEIGVVGLENDYLVTKTGVSRLSVTDDAIIHL
jgi:Xaa-Pro aminopeptidase